MRLSALVLSGLLASFASSQSPLTVYPAGGNYHTWVTPANPAAPQVFFDLTVNTQVTLTSLRTLIATPPGGYGWSSGCEVSLWLTSPGITTFVGSETTPANWYEAAKWPVTISSVSGTTAPFTLDTCIRRPYGGSLTLPPGTYGCAVRYTNLDGVFSAVPTVPNTFATAELSLTGGAIQHTAFTSSPAAPATGSAGWSWVGEISYVNGTVATNCASASPMGAGCNATGAPLQLAASAVPRRGLTISLLTSNAPTAGFGVSFLSPTCLHPAVDLVIIGAPGCLLSADFGSSAGVTISNLGLPGLGMSYALTIPNWPVLVGTQLYAQSAWLDAAANAFGAVTSNGLELVID